jgi:hypothetical protein
VVILHLDSQFKSPLSIPQRGSKEGERTAVDGEKEAIEERDIDG